MADGMKGRTVTRLEKRGWKNWKVVVMRGKEKRRISEVMTEMKGDGKGLYEKR